MPSAARVKETAQKLRAEHELLEWVVRLTLSGMSTGMLRYRLLKKQEEIEEKLEAMPADTQGADR